MFPGLSEIYQGLVKLIWVVISDDSGILFSVATFLKIVFSSFNINLLCFY